MVSAISSPVMPSMVVGICVGSEVGRVGRDRHRAERSRQALVVSVIRESG
jgi:hypothetical protein